MFCFSLGINTAFAETDTYQNRDYQIVNDVMSFEHGGDLLSHEQLDYLISHPDIAQERARMDVEYLKNKQQEDILQSLQQTQTLTPNNSPSIRSTSISLGTDATITSCDISGGNGSYWGVGQWNYYSDPNSNYTSALSQAIGVGGANSWGSVGYQVYISGPSGTSRNAYITFQGGYSGDLIAGAGGSSNAIINLTVYDQTRSSYISSADILDVDGQMVPRTYSTTFNRAFYVNLEAGHTYKFIYTVRTAVSQYDPQTSISNFYNGQNSGLQAYRVNIDF